MCWTRSRRWDTSTGTATAVAAVIAMGMGMWAAISCRQQVVLGTRGRWRVAAARATVGLAHTIGRHLARPPHLTMPLTPDTHITSMACPTGTRMLPSSPVKRRPAPPQLYTRRTGAVRLTTSTNMGTSMGMVQRRWRRRGKAVAAQTHASSPRRRGHRCFAPTLRHRPNRLVMVYGPAAAVQLPRCRRCRLAASHRPSHEHPAGRRQQLPPPLPRPHLRVPPLPQP